MSVSKNSVVKNVCPAADWADWEVLACLINCDDSALGHIVVSWLGCFDASFDARFPKGDCVDRLRSFAASVFSDFSDCESLAFAVLDFIYAILTSFFCLGRGFAFNMR